MSNNSKRTPSYPRGSSPMPRMQDVELPFGDDELTPLRADDPTPQHVPEYPSGGRRPMKKHEEAIQTTVYNTEKQDEELPQSYDPAQLDDGFKPSFLYVERGPGAGQLVQIKQGPLVCGRASISDLRLQHSSISRRHSQLTRAGERFYIKDLGSQNGTFVNKIKIATEIEIYPGDQIALGNAIIKLRGPLQQAQAPASAKGELKGKPAGKVLNASRQKKSNVSVGKVAIFAGAVGFGLAGALMFALVQMPSAGPSFQPIPAEPAEVDPPSPVPARTAQERASVVETRLREAMREQEAKEVAPPPPPVEETIAAPADPPRAAAVIAAASMKKTPKPKAVARATGGRSAPASEEEEAEEEEVQETSTPASGPKRAAILARYEEGNVAASIEAARNAGDKDLAGKLTRFQTEYQAAGSAMAAKNGTAAIKHFDAALKLDEQLSSGWSRYGTEIRKQLSSLWTLVGFAHLDAENDTGARQAFSAALRHDPENAKAKAQLAKLGNAEKAGGREDADEAFGDEKPAPKAARTPVKAAPAESRSSAIDDAFGD